MEWKILNKNLHQEAYVSDNYTLTIGNTEDCEIILNSNKPSFIEAQIVIDSGFLFKVTKSDRESFFYETTFDFHNQEYLFEFKNDALQFGENFVRENSISELDISNIFNSMHYKHTLIEVQKKLSKNGDNFTQIDSNQLIYILNNACFFLDQKFWQDKDPYSSEDRLLYKKYIWCVWAQICEFGLLTMPILDPTISEIMVNSASCIYLERKGQLVFSALKFDSNDSLMTIIERICTRVGRRIDESLPFCDARLKDGSRAHAIIPPLALNGPCLTIRKFPSREISMHDLIESNSIPPFLFSVLQNMIENKKNILISGGTGTGKTTLLNCLSSFIPHTERILTIEDAAELKLQQPHIIRLECRNGNIENKGNVSIRDLLKNALRMRPDRIIVGECRGGEALDMLQAMNTGHDGSMTTLHANAPVDALRRLETLVMFASSELTSRAIREQIATAIHFVIQLSRKSDGKRIVSSIIEIIDLCEKSNKFITKTVYEFQ